MKNSTVHYLLVAFLPVLMIVGLRRIEAQTKATSPSYLTMSLPVNHHVRNEHVYDSYTVRQLTHSAANDVQPSWSPDGSTVAFVSDSIGGSDGYDLFAVNPDGNGLRALAYFTFTDYWGGRFYDPSWLSTSGDILLMDFKFFWEVMRFSLKGATAAGALPVTRSISDGDSPYMKRILFVPGGQGAMSPIVSPDTSKLAWFARINTGATPLNQQVQQVRIYSGGLTSFIGNTDAVGNVIFQTNPGGFIDGAKSIAFSPDGSKLVVSACVGGWYDSGKRRDLYIVDLKNGTTRRVTTTGEQGTDNAYVSWSNKNVIAFSSMDPADSTYDLYTINPDGTGLQRLTNTSSTNEIDPSWSPDGTKLAFASDVNGSWNIYVMDVSNGQATGQPIKLSVPVLKGVAGDTVLVPLNVEFPSNSSYSSVQLSLQGFEGKLAFAGIAPDSGMIGKANWIYEINDTDTLMVTAFAGAHDITGSGVLMWLKFFIPSKADTGFVPIIIDTAFFNTGTTPVIATSGGIEIGQSILYGDVDMNGKVQAYDAAFILKYLVGQVALDSAQLVRARVSFDTTVSALDASLILKYVVGLIDTLPYNRDSLFNASGLITMDSLTVTPGEIVQVPLHLTGGKNILSFEGQITYDTTNLRMQGIMWSSVNNNLMVYTNDSAGTMKFAGARSQPDSGSGTFADLAFKLNPGASGPTTIVLSKLRWNKGPLMKNVAKAVLVVTSLDEAGNGVPKEFRLSQNYPNPFNPTTVISYDLPKRSHVLITVYDILGREVKTLVNEDQKAGSYRVTLVASDLPSGVYFYRIVAGSFVQTKKLVLVK